MSEPASNPALFDLGTIDLSISTEITLRDLFAGFALAGYWACDNGCGQHEKAAPFAYQAADAMLKERAHE